MARTGRKKKLYINSLNLILEEYYKEGAYYINSTSYFNNSLFILISNLFEEKLIDVQSDLLRLHLEKAKENKWTILPS